MPSIILSMPFVEDKNRRCTLKIEGTKKLEAIINCINTVI